MFVSFHCHSHYSKDFRTIRETDIACGSIEKKFILIKRLSLFILFMKGWNVELTSVTAFMSPSFNLMDKIERFIEIGFISWNGMNTLISLMLAVQTCGQGGID